MTRPAEFIVIFQGIPHVRGGEPDVLSINECSTDVFPTCVGVNRPGEAGRTSRRVFPTCVGVNRAPWHFNGLVDQYSPRAWG